MAAGIIVHPHTVTRPQCFITASNNTADDQGTFQDINSPIQYSTTDKSSVSPSCTTTGTEEIGTFKMSISKCVFQADILVYIPWGVATANAGSSGRINVELRKTDGASPIPNTSKQNGVIQSIASVNPDLQDLLLIRLPKTAFVDDDTLDIYVEFEVTTAGGSGTCTIEMNHKPQSAGLRSLLLVRP